MSGVFLAHQVALAGDDGLLHGKCLGGGAHSIR